MTRTINQDNLNASVRMLDKMGDANLEQIKLVDAALGERLEKLGELFKTPSFCDQLIVCPDHQAARKLFEDNGVLLSQEETDAVILQIKTLVHKLVENDGELSEEDLEQISGGWSWEGFFGGIMTGGSGGAAIGAIIGNNVGTCTLPGIGSISGAIVGAVIGAVVGTVVGGILGGLLW